MHNNPLHAIAVGMEALLNNLLLHVNMVEAQNHQALQRRHHSCILL